LDNLPSESLPTDSILLIDIDNVNRPSLAEFNSDLGNHSREFNPS